MAASLTGNSLLPVQGLTGVSRIYYGWLLLHQVTVEGELRGATVKNKRGQRRRRNRHLGFRLLNVSDTRHNKPGLHWEYTNEKLLHVCSWEDRKKGWIRTRSYFFLAAGASFFWFSCLFFFFLNTRFGQFSYQGQIFVVQTFQSSLGLSGQNTCRDKHLPADDKYLKHGFIFHAMHSLRT